MTAIELPPLPVEDPAPIPVLRADYEAAQSDASSIALEKSLGVAGCSYEAGHLLRPRRKLWREAPWAAEAKRWLATFEALDYHTGNQHHYQKRLAELTVLAGNHDLAMRRAADTMVADRQRKGYSKTLRETWVTAAPRLEPLRAREDWDALLADPREWQGLST